MNSVLDEKPRSFLWHCEECDVARMITVDWDFEPGEFGTILNTWPIFSPEPPCPGLVEIAAGRDTPDGYESDSDVVLSDEVDEERWVSSRPWCPFDGEDDYGPRGDHAALLSMWRQARDYERGYCMIGRAPTQR